MKLIKAYVRRYMVPKVIEALKALNVPRISAVHVEALHGDEVPDHHFESEEGFNAGGSYTKMIKLELICNDECIERVKETILKTAKTGYKGDGMIAVSPVDEAINIRTGKSAIKG
jgi:nitrogen regulatory protein P-II 1